MGGCGAALVVAPKLRKLGESLINGLGCADIAA